MEKIMMLAHDYWHKKETIEPVADYFQKDFDVRFTTNPKDLYSFLPDLLISFKDPIEDDQIPTPIWCDEAWTQDCTEKIRNGMGFIAVHAALTDLPWDHPFVRDAIRATFERHPEACEVTFRPGKAHEILDGVDEFVLCEKDEHYQMKLYAEYPTNVIASTISQHGEQPALWVHELGQGRICCFTPGHTTGILVSEPYLHILNNAAKWCLK